MAVKVTDECIGCGVCAQICPELFELDEETGKAKVLKDNADCAQEAADSCPVNAIVIE